MPIAAHCTQKVSSNIPFDLYSNQIITLFLSFYMIKWMLTVNFNITWKFDTIFDVSTVFTAQVPRWRRNYNKLNNINQSSDCEQSNDCTCEISSRKYEKKRKKKWIYINRLLRVRKTECVIECTYSYVNKTLVDCINVYANESRLCMYTFSVLKFATPAIWVVCALEFLHKLSY